MDAYIIIEKASKDSLVGEVNRRIEMGYIPMGGIAIDKSYGLYQAMYLPGGVRPA